MIVSGSQHFVIPKRLLMLTLALTGSAFLGAALSSHLYRRRAEHFLRQKTATVKLSNKQLEEEQREYRDLFAKLTEKLGDGEARAEEYSKESVGSFHQLASRLLEGLQNMQDLLEEKEFQLWEKEGLLEYQEERLMNTEDLEKEMAAFINGMAADLVKAGRADRLPTGLAQEPYYGLNAQANDPDAGAPQRSAPAVA